MGNRTTFLGIEIKRDVENRIIYLSQINFIQTVE